MSYANAFRMSAAMLFACFGLIAADDLGLGTWKLDTSKSTHNGEPVKISSTVTFTMSGDEITRVENMVGPDGTKTTSRWTGKLDGKPYPTSQTGVTIAMQRAGTNKSEATVRRDGKVVNNVSRTISADGKLMHTTMKGTDENGKPFVRELYFNKQ